MQRIAMIGTAAALALTATAAGAQEECRAQLEALQQEMPDISRLPPDQELLARQTLRDLAWSARQLAAGDHEAACIATLDALASAMTTYHINLMDPEPGAVRGADDQRLPDAAVNELDPRLVPLTAAGLAYATGELRGNSVFNYRGERVGEFQGLLTGPAGYATHLVMGHGGFWDMFEDRAAIPVELVRWDRRKRLFYVPLDEQELDGSPGYGGEGWDLEMNDDYYAGVADE